MGGVSFFLLTIVSHLSSFIFHHLMSLTSRGFEYSLNIQLSSLLFQSPSLLIFFRASEKRKINTSIGPVLYETWVVREIEISAMLKNQ